MLHEEGPAISPDRVLFLDSHSANVAAVNRRPRVMPEVAVKPAWKPSPPSAEPWRSAYLALTPERQQVWDSMSPAQRAQVFGV